MLFSDQEVWFKLEFKKIQVNLEDFLIDPRGFDPWHIYLKKKKQYAEELEKYNSYLIAQLLKFSG
jgi:hypothetical protein